jgi:hypothetical protein
MPKKLALILACAALQSVLSFSAHASPGTAPPKQVAMPNFTLVRDFCGLGFHRSPYGNCVRNGTPYVYAPAVVAPPPVVVAPVVCPYGYHYVGQYGRCFPY